MIIVRVDKTDLKLYLNLQKNVYLKRTTVVSKIK